MEDLGYEAPNEDGSPHAIHIAQITFAFHNEQVIGWLKERGALIRAEKWKELDELNGRISKELKRGVKATRTVGGERGGTLEVPLVDEL